MALQQINGELAQLVEVGGPKVPTNAAIIPTGIDVQNPVQLVFDARVAAHSAGNSLGWAEPIRLVV